MPCQSLLTLNKVKLLALHDRWSWLSKLSELYRVTKDKNQLEIEKEHLARKAEALMVDFEQEKQVRASTGCLHFLNQPP